MTYFLLLFSAPFHLLGDDSSRATQSAVCFWKTWISTPRSCLWQGSWTAAAMFSPRIISSLVAAYTITFEYLPAAREYTNPCRIFCLVLCLSCLFVVWLAADKSPSKRFSLFFSLYNALFIQLQLIFLFTFIFLFLGPSYWLQLWRELWDRTSSFPSLTGSQII